MSPANKGLVAGAGLLRFRPPNMSAFDPPEVFNYDYYCVWFPLIPARKKGGAYSVEPDD